MLEEFKKLDEAMEPFIMIEDTKDSTITFNVDEIYVATFCKYYLPDSNNPNNTLRGHRIENDNSWYKEWNELNSDQKKWLNQIEVNCLKEIPFPDSGVESSLARSQPQYEAARMRKPQLISFENIHIFNKERPLAYTKFYMPLNYSIG